MHRQVLLVVLLSSLRLSHAFKAFKYPPRYHKRSPLETGVYDPNDDVHPSFPRITAAPKVPEILNQQLKKRDAEDTIYTIETPEPFMATPGGSCRAGGTTSTLCPMGYECACQVAGSSRCLTNTIAGLGAQCSSFAGAVAQPATTSWDLGGRTLSTWATAWGQCGGTTPTFGATWNGQKTQCPIDQLCSCQNIYYSQCIPTESVTNGGDCPANRNACPTSDVTLPPPTETASLYSQCGGTCWTGPTNCPTVDGTAASCWTETSPVPGAYAMCDTIRPDGGQYRLVRRDANPYADPTPVMGSLPPQARGLVMPVMF